jgi:hypothetical protein
MKTDLNFLSGNKMNPVNGQNLSNKTIYFILFLIAFAVVFSSSYNPLNFRIMYVDSSVYITVAQGIIRGQLPYQDLVDNKGPLTYLMSVPGFFLGRFTGIWITEFILLFISVFFAYKTALFFGNPKKALFGTAFSSVALVSFLLVNAGTEEYALPFLMLSFYIFTRYFFSDKQDVSFLELIVLGFCFGAAVLIRLNMFPLWAGFCVIIFIDLLIKRRFFLFGKCIIGFCLGIVIIFVPVFLYLKLNGIMGPFMEQVIFAGAERGFGGTNLKVTEKNFFLVLGRTNCALPLWLGIFWIVTKYKQMTFTYYLGYVLSYFLMVLFLSFSGGGNHYNLVLIPFFVPALTYFADVIYSCFSLALKNIQSKKIKYTILVVFFCFMFAEGLVRYFFYLTTKLYDNSRKHLVNAGRMIDENTKPGDKIISLGINGYIYPFTQREIASRYLYQGSGLDHLPGAKNEFINDILTSKPAIIATITEAGRDEIIYSWHEPIIEMIGREYCLLSDENGFNIYIRNDR